MICVGDQLEGQNLAVTKIESLINLVVLSAFNVNSTNRNYVYTPKSIYYDRLLSIVSARKGFRKD